MGFVEELYTNSTEFSEFIHGVNIKELPTIKTDIGRIIGGEAFYLESLEKFKRKKDEISLESMRTDDQYFDTLEKIYYEFKRKYGIDPDNLRTNTHDGKRQSGIFLIYLKDNVGLTYREVKYIGIKK